MSLPIYFAPLEGVTDAVYRRVHHAHFTGIDKYFIPFISPTQNLVLTPRERSNVSPEANAGMYAVPQVLTKRADHFLWAEKQLAAMGYEEININLGCPSGTVTAKGKGAGMLEHPVDLELFLDEVFKKTKVRVSLKTRIGFSSPDEFAGVASFSGAIDVSNNRYATREYWSDIFGDIFGDFFVFPKRFYVCLVLAADVEICLRGSKLDVRRGSRRFNGYFTNRCYVIYHGDDLRRTFANRKDTAFSIYRCHSSVRGRPSNCLITTINGSGKRCFIVYFQLKFLLA